MTEPFPFQKIQQRLHGQQVLRTIFVAPELPGCLISCREDCRRHACLYNSPAKNRETADDAPVLQLLAARTNTTNVLVEDLL